MYTWEFSDGTTWESGGLIVGDSDFANWWREAFNEQKQLPELASRIRVAAPAVSVPLDLNDDYLLNMFAYQVAARYQLSVNTNYLPNDALMPNSVREHKRRLQPA